MIKLLSFFRTSSPFILLLLGIGIEGLSKLIEKKLTNVALGLQLMAFIIIVYGLFRLINKK
ncbi:hypothetical protein EZL74_07140 [Flavobacterium silvisoli]|uniref:Uncharacterized protein n=1 Tax=Flavobacterium silvisoli TaxID=2529433 RepID=A0A4Q9Z423_9FLAO|nr:hypothetical protein [Flavobacterium silvisoli]TBX69146.1 hypothetical protein EZL74_07140 [Flavobacterium silvisoli]